MSSLCLCPDGKVQIRRDGVLVMVMLVVYHVDTAGRLSPDGKAGRPRLAELCAPEEVARGKSPIWTGNLASPLVSE